jgi:hypothetical protein
MLSLGADFGGELVGTDFFLDSAMNTNLFPTQLFATRRVRKKTFSGKRRKVWYNLSSAGQ